MTSQSPTSHTPTLSVMIPCKNNQRTMGRVLSSVRELADQLVVVDSGSTDSTMDLVNACRTWGTCEVVLIETHWRGFVKTKQLALDACSADYTLWLDSDEPVSPELASSIKAAMAIGVDGATVNRVVEYKGRLLRHCWQPEHRLRLVKTSLVRDNKARFNGIDPHDYLEIDSPHSAPLIEGVLIHESFESFAQHIDNARRLSLVSANSMHDMGKRTSPLKLMTSPPGAFLKQLVLKGSWRDGYAGWLCAATSAAAALMKHMMLYEMQQDHSRSVRFTTQAQSVERTSTVADLHDDRIGRLGYEPQMEEFVGAVEYQGKQIQFAIAAEDGRINGVVLEAAYRVLNQLETLVHEAIQFAADDCLQFWNSNKPPTQVNDYSIDDFANEIELFRVHVNFEGGVNITFECNGVMPGHGLTVSGSPEFQMEDSVMDG